jgi:pyrroline-5-carboxylate reductase
MSEVISSGGYSIKRGIPVGKIAIVGVGAMGEAIFRAALEGGWHRESFILTHHRADRVAELAGRYGEPVVTDNSSAVRDADVVLLAVRPQNYPEVLAEIKPSIKANSLVISIAAALDIPWLEAHLASNQAIARAVPPPTSWIRKGVCFLSCNSRVTAEHRMVINSLFGYTCERVWWIDDKYIDAVTSICSAITPYMGLVASAIMDAGYSLGVPEEIVEEAVREGCKAAGIMISDPAWPVPKIIGEVATRGGLTEASLKAMLEAGVPQGIQRGVLRMVERSEELRKELS